jgi:hypothetical protein
MKNEFFKKVKHHSLCIICTVNAIEAFLNYHPQLHV